MVLFSKVVLALMSGRPAHEILDTQRAAHLVRMRELTERKRTGDLADALACDFELFHLDADIKWIELAGARVERVGRRARRGDPMIETEVDAVDERTPSSDGALLAASDLHKQFGRSTALAGLSVEVRGGRGRRGARAERFGQVDPAALPGRHHPARPGCGRLPRPDAGEPVGRDAHPAPP